jgi:hypothetical protein
LNTGKRVSMKKPVGLSDINKSGGSRRDAVAGDDQLVLVIGVNCGAGGIREKVRDAEYRDPQRNARRGEGVVRARLPRRSAARCTPWIPTPRSRLSRAVQRLPMGALWRCIRRPLDSSRCRPTCRTEHDCADEVELSSDRQRDASGLVTQEIPFELMRRASMPTVPSLRTAPCRSPSTRESAEHSAGSERGDWPW